MIYQLRDRPLARLGLVIAAVLHLLGGGLLPLLHHEAVSASETTMQAHEGHDGCVPVEAHDAAHCAVCAGTAAVARPGSADRAPQPCIVRMAATGHAPESLPPFLHSRSAPARAPPSAA